MEKHWTLSEDEAKEQYTGDQLTAWKGWKRCGQLLRDAGFEKFAFVQRDTCQLAWASSIDEELHSFRGQDEHEWAESEASVILERQSVIYESLLGSESESPKDVCEVIAKFLPQWRPKVMQPKLELLDVFRNMYRATVFRFWGKRYTIVTHKDDTREAYFIAINARDFVAVYRSTSSWLVAATTLVEPRKTGDTSELPKNKFPTAPCAWSALYFNVICNIFEAGLI